MKKIVFREEACMGCRLCEVYCIVQHSMSKDIIKSHRREETKPLSRVTVEVKKPHVMTVRCQQCKTPLCVASCLSGAMHRDAESGLVTHDADKCIGCWTCTMVCPFGAIVMDKKRKVVAKCDLCQGMQVPACVENCPNEALVYQEVSP